MIILGLHIFLGTFFPNTLTYVITLQLHTVISILEIKKQRGKVISPRSQGKITHVKDLVPEHKKHLTHSKLSFYY